MHPVSCTNAHHDMTDLVNYGWLKIKKIEHLEKERNLYTK